MKNCKGSALIIGVFFLSLILIVGGAIFGMYVSAHNYAVQAEEGIKAAYTNNQNVLSSYTVKIQEMAQIPEMYKNDLKEVYTKVLEGRYGENGSQAMWQWLKEQNPNLDPSMYQTLQQTMEAGRNEFKVNQTALIDRKREYDTQQRLFLRGFFLKMAGFPKINMDDYKIILDDKTNAAFDSGKVEPIKLR